MFSPERTAQLCAEFARRSGGSINVLKLVKLVYLCDRLSMKRYAAPITYDTYVSMDHGPVPSGTLDLINKCYSADWAKWLRRRRGYQVSLRNHTYAVEDLDELNAADLKTIEETWKKFGDMDEWNLRRYTHHNCREWQHPVGSSLPISEREIFRALGWSREESAAGQERIQEQRDLSREFSREFSNA